jgi:hypothetical protein
MKPGKWLWLVLPALMAVAADRLALENRLTQTSGWAQDIKAQLNRIEDKLDRHMEK